MKKNFITLFLCFFCTVCCHAQVTINGDGYTLIATIDKNECSIKCGNSPTSPTTLVIPNSVTYNGKEYIVTTIPQSAFQNEKNFIGTLTLPNNIRRIEQSAFEGCTGFTGNLVFPETTEYVGNKAFRYCSGFTTITILGSEISGHNQCLTGLNGIETVISLTDIDNLPNSGFKNFINSIIDDDDIDDGVNLIQPEEGESSMPIFLGGDASSPTSWSTAKNWYPEEVPSSNKSVAIANDLTISSSERIEINSISNDKSSTIVIEEGGQLIYNEGTLSNVRIEKNITGYNEVSNQEGWYVISSPMTNNISNDNYNNLIDENGYYDLYYYNEEDFHWYNYKDGTFSTFNLGQGYLYAKRNSATIVSVGKPNNSAVSFTLSAASELTPNGNDLNGFNLVGNPFTFDICKGDGCAISNEFLEEGYYSLSTNGTWTAKSDSEPISVCEGILVETIDSSADGESLTINKIPYKKTRKADNDVIAITVSNELYEDVAYIKFGDSEGSGLRKIAHMNNDIQMVYIPKDGVNYAITNMDENIREIPVSFQASTMGKYTISIDATKHNSGNIYLLDNITGDKIDILNGDYTFIAQSSHDEERFTLLISGNSGTGDEHFAFINNNNIIINDIEGSASVQIFDVTGRQIIANEFNGSACISAEALNDGIYIIRMIDDNGIKTQKIVIQ
ncbi:MAG: leucine-rich repeat protein [Bacteroidales bacterium]|nr:leucine-rich repeat protein [Bacteroidales bacterium]